MRIIKLHRVSLNISACFVLLPLLDLGDEILHEVFSQIVLVPIPNLGDIALGCIRSIIIYILLIGITLIILKVGLSA